jgi:predicted hydrocarbon binding protein
LTKISEEICSGYGQKKDLSNRSHDGNFLESLRVLGKAKNPGLRRYLSMKEKAEKSEAVPINQVVQALQSTSRRIALIHLAYAKAIIEELGEEKGMKLIAKAIKNYGAKIGEKTREEVLKKGLEAIPENFNKGESYALPIIPGMHDRRERVDVEGVKRNRAYGCVLAEVWKEYGEEKLGRLYCYMDVAKYMAYNPNYKYAHTKAMPDGDEYCEFEVKRTTEEERKDFLAEDKDWFYIDK